MKIIEALRSAIEIGNLSPGTRLIEKDLCEQLFVSRTCLREALREMQAEGILGQGSRGLMVISISPEDAWNVYRLRSVLEALVVEQFIERSNDDEMRDLLLQCEELKAAYNSGNLRAMLDSKRAFYNCICAGARNTIAFDMIIRLVLKTSSLRARSLQRVARQQESIREIDQLTQAIVSRDVEKARTVAIAHVMNAARSALAVDETISV